ncbi:unnamed protein product [Ilex paraguariensis]|uniref:inorganic diphosphatase n=1 Tax=Ilex paraguariensis TaxID=185542 RepID=A0ABC8ST90_9AQUA
MAATRIVVSASTTAATTLLFKGPLRRPQSLSFFCPNNRLVPKKRLFTCSAIYNPQVQIKEEGQPETLDYRVFFLDDSGKKGFQRLEFIGHKAFCLLTLQVSPWHDIPLHLGDSAFSFIVEIPKESSAKMEVATDEPFTPIKQDTKKGKLRYYPYDMLLHFFLCGCFPFHCLVMLYLKQGPLLPPVLPRSGRLAEFTCLLRYNINWNYGLLPQTWEDPSFANHEVDGAFGDNDPVDVVEIGDSRGKIGQILKVKPLGALAMIDEGELDWKIVAISLDDPRASLVNDVDDVEKHFPGTLTAIRDWFRDYKIPDGKPANKFGLGNKAANKDYALQVITEANESWAKLVKRSTPSGELSLV